MLKKMLTLFTALPLTLALCGQASAIGLSNEAKARKSLCSEVAAIKNKADPRYILNKFCDKVTKSFHCTSGKRAGVFKYDGACDDPQLCTNPVILQACKSQCVDLRSAVQDEKASKIAANLNKCQAQQSMTSQRATLPVQTQPQRTPSITPQRTQSLSGQPQPQRAPSFRQEGPGEVVPPTRTPSMNYGRTGSVSGKQPVMENPTYAPPPPPPPMPTDGYPKSKIKQAVPQSGMGMEEEVLNPQDTPPASYTEFEPVAATIPSAAPTTIPPAPRHRQ